MKNYHIDPTLISEETESFAAGVTGTANDYPMPNPFEVARLLGDKSEGFHRELQQGLMSEILDHAPQGPSRRPSRRVKRFS
jgi:hypothetical protein